MGEENEIVCVVDEDVSACRSLKRLIASLGFKVKAISSLLFFTQAMSEDKTICLILDEHSVKKTEVQTVLNSFSDLRLIVSTTRDSSEVRHLARDLQADMCLQKPIDEQALLDSIKWSFARKT